MDTLPLIKEMESGQKYKIFCDLDGVLVDFQVGVTNALIDAYGDTSMYNKEAYSRDKNYRDLMWNAIEKWQQKHGPILWSTLPMMSDGMELWNYILPYNPTILTAVGQPQYGADKQKREWVDKHLGANTSAIYVNTAVLKAHHAAPNHILIDDQMRAIKPWIEAGGIGILHKSAVKTIEQLKGLK